MPTLRLLLLFCGLGFTPLAACAQVAPSPAEKPAVTVEVAQGTLGGEAMNDGTYLFRGVPFASPPVGDLRWAPPKDPVKWAGVRYTPKDAPACTQVDQGWNHVQASTSSEDCLYLAIRTPAVTQGKALPVMFMIHGGGNVVDSGAVFMDTTLPHNENVVLVSIEYRMGVFGFLSHPELTAESAHKASGNYGLMDQIKALQWVRANIDRFGGDAGNITIFGNSAGGMDVGQLLVSPLSRGLFAKAIEQSGTPQFGGPVRSLADNEAMGLALAKAVKVGNLKDLRAADAKTLLMTSDHMWGAPWVTSVVDGYVLREAPEVTFRTGQEAPIPLMVGVSAQEFSQMPGTAKATDVVASTFGDKADKARILYGFAGETPPAPDPLLGDIGMQVTTDRIFRCPAAWVARSHSANGHPAWLFQLDVNDPAEKRPVHHGSELHYIFLSPPPGTAPEAWPPLQAYWANFARSGTPNGKALATWPAHGKSGAYMEFTSDGPRTGQNLRGDICALLDRP